LPNPLQNPGTAAADDAPGTRYAYKASLVGAAHQFELTDQGLSWRIAGRSGVWPYADINIIRLSYRPVSMQSRRFRADIGNTHGASIAILSTSWQSAALMAPQDHDYRVFITALHARMARYRGFWCARSRPVSSPAPCFWSALPPCLRGRSVALSGATGR
jgi:hypothetical protein